MKATKNTNGRIQNKAHCNTPFYSPGEWEGVSKIFERGSPFQFTKQPSRVKISGVL